MIFNSLLLVTSVVHRVVAFRPQSVLRWEISCRSRPVDCHKLYFSIEDAEMVNEMSSDDKFQSLMSAMESLKNDQTKHHYALLCILKDEEIKKIAEITDDIIYATDLFEQSISNNIINGEKVKSDNLIAASNLVKALQSLFIWASLLIFVVHTYLQF
jgi:hypothetical protein